MTQIILENLDPLILEKLQVLATRHNRSLTGEIQAILEQVTEAEVSLRVTRRADFRAQLAQARSLHGDRVFSDSVELLREDRDR